MPKSSPSNAGPGVSGGTAPPDYAAALGGRAHRLRDLGVLAVEGPDRTEFLQGQLTQDVRTLAPGQARAAAGLTPKGKLIYWGRVWNAGEQLLLLIPAGPAGLAVVAAHLSKYAVFQKVAIRDATSERAVLGIYGAAPSTAPAELLGLPPEGEFAAELLGPREAVHALAQELERGGSTRVSVETGEILRVEAGRPRMGKDADETNLPDELGLSSAISTTKGCYVGQEIVARLRTYGRVNRRLAGLRFPGEPVAEGTVFPNPEKPDHELARVTSAVRSPRFGWIGLGLVFRDVVDGSTLADPARADQVAVVSRLPFASASASPSASA